MARESSDILYLSRKDIEQACQNIDAVAIMHDVFKMHGLGQVILPEEAYLNWVNDQGETVRSLNMPGYIGGLLHTSGTKIINGNILLDCLLKILLWLHIFTKMRVRSILVYGWNVSQ